MTAFAKISKNEDKERQNQHLTRSASVENVRALPQVQIPVPSTHSASLRAGFTRDKFMQNKANLCKVKLPQALL